MLSSAEAMISFGPIRSPEITEKLHKSLLRIMQTSRECVVELFEVL